MPKGGSKPGERRGGRKAGTPNKASAALQERLASLGCDPIEALARIAMNRKTPLAIRVKVLCELAQYVYPKRKAVEHSGEGAGPPQVEWRFASVIDKTELTRRN